LPGKVAVVFDHLIEVADLIAVCWSGTTKALSTPVLASTVIRSLGISVWIVLRTLFRVEGIRGNTRRRSGFGGGGGGSGFGVDFGRGTEAINSLIVCILPAFSTTSNCEPCARWIDATVAAQVRLDLIEDVVDWVVPPRGNTTETSSNRPRLMSSSVLTRGINSRGMRIAQLHHHQHFVSTDEREVAQS
jgi:hypothetical protein